MLRFGLIGNPVVNSLSPTIHQQFAQQFDLTLQYEKIQGSGQRLQYQIETFLYEGGEGLNVTMPFKQQAFSLVCQASETSLKSQAVNTLWMSQGILCGDNTDGKGLIRDLIRYIDPSNKRILILGAGGAVCGILPELFEYTRQIVVANRTLDKAMLLATRFPILYCCTYSDISEHFDIVINATAAIFDENNVLIPEIVFQQADVCYDLNYLAYSKTPFSCLADSYGSQGVDGIGMLVEQAAESFFIWHQLKPKTIPVITALRKNQK